MKKAAKLLAPEFKLLAKYDKSVPIKEDGMGGACRAHDGDERCVNDFRCQT
jgi:hypothetical protein